MPFYTAIDKRAFSSRSRTCCIQEVLTMGLQGETSLPLSPPSGRALMCRLLSLRLGNEWCRRENTG